MLSMSGNLALSSQHKGTYAHSLGSPQVDEEMTMTAIPEISFGNPA